MRHHLFLVLLIFMFVSLFGMNLAIKMDKNGKMSNCPLMNNSSSICQMSFTDHIAKWRGLFETTPQLNVLFLMLALFVALVFIIRLVTPLVLAPPLYLFYKNYKKEHAELNLSNDLLTAFADGILHPKIYN